MSDNHSSSIPSPITKKTNKTLGIYFTSAERGVGKTSIALGAVHLLSVAGSSIGVFRPVAPRSGQDNTLAMLSEYASTEFNQEESTGVSAKDFYKDPEAAIPTILAKYEALKKKCDWVIVLGTDYESSNSPSELTLNAILAANLQVPVVLCVRADTRTHDQLEEVIENLLHEVEEQHATVSAILINKARPDEVKELVNQYKKKTVPTLVIPNEPILSAPSLNQIVTAIDAKVLSGLPDNLDYEVINILVAGMQVNSFLQRLQMGSLVIMPGDRDDILVALAAALASGNYPQISGIIISGGILPSPEIIEIFTTLNSEIPLMTTEFDSFDTARLVSETTGSMATGSLQKINAAIDLMERYALTSEVLDKMSYRQSDVVTPQMFEYHLVKKSRENVKRIVLPEGNDDRILIAAQKVLDRKIAHITILGNPEEIKSRARELSLELQEAEIIDPTVSSLREKFAQQYTDLRQHKGMTLEKAQQIVTDVSYFGTLMVHNDLVDGMVSGADHTTAHTIKPAFEIIKTKPGISTVSSVFFMCLAHRVLVFGDCAVVPNPSVEQLADIAISSAQTATQFGIDPRVAMLSYSTGNSGSGDKVDKVRSAKDLVLQKQPDILCDGPIQYDAAVDATVAAKKMPGSAVAGKATVLVFSDLDAGNTTYKAVQRSADAIAIGPVLQGIKKPINDLSRGALVDDIVNTIAITAIQAQQSTSH